MGIKEAYMTGRGRVVVRAKYEFEELKDGRTQIIFSEIPYQLTKEMLLKKLAELVNDGRVTGVSSVDDYSDRKQPVRIAVTVKKGEDPNVVVNQLFEYSPLQDTFSMIMLALVNGRPRTLPLQELLRLFIEHRVNVIRRRTQHQLRQARQRAHIIEGLLIALVYIDEIIRVIRSSANPAEARTRLMGIAVSAEILQASAQRPGRQGIDGADAEAGRRHPVDAVAAIDRPRGRQAGAGIRRPQGEHRELRSDPGRRTEDPATWFGPT